MAGNELDVDDKMKKLEENTVAIETLIHIATKEINDTESNISSIKMKNEMLSNSKSHPEFDIDTNIRRLEKTQQQITAAIEKCKSFKQNENIKNRNNEKYDREEKREDERNSVLIRRHSVDDLFSSGRPPDRLKRRRNSTSQYQDSIHGDHHSADKYNSPVKHGLQRLVGSFGKGRRKLYQVSTSQNKSQDEELETSDDSQPHILSINDFTQLLNSLPAHGFEQSHNNVGDNEEIPDEKVGNPITKPETTNSISTNSTDTNLRNSYINGKTVSSPDNLDDSEYSEHQKIGEISNVVKMSKNQNASMDKKILYVAKEIMTSEKVYVAVLRLLNIDFRNYIQEERQKSKSIVIPTEDFLKLFSNLPELLMLNSDFLRDFEDRVHNWSKRRKISDVIVNKGPYLKLYTAYVKNFADMSSHFDECCKKYQKFGKLVKEFEKFPQCRNLKLSHFMLKPVQRLPQYKMLLEDYLKHLEASNDDYDDTTTALMIVSEAAEHANETIKQMVRNY